MMSSLKKYSLFFFMICSFLLNSCSYSYLKGYNKTDFKNIEDFSVFPNDFNKITYKTSFNIMGRSLSGILLIKKTPSQEYRFVFMSELGLKYFDLGISTSANKNDFKTYYLMSALSRGNIENILFNDFSKLLITNKIINDYSVLENHDNQSIALSYTDAESEIICILNEGNFEKILWKDSSCGKSHISFSNYENNTPQSIDIHNKKYGINFKMNKLIMD